MIELLDNFFVVILCICAGIFAIASAFCVEKTSTRYKPFNKNGKLYNDKDNT